MTPKIPSFLAGDDLSPFIAKFCLPAGFVLVAVLVAQPPAKPGSLVLAVLLAVAALLQFYICGLVRAEPDCLWYRRFFRWERIEYEEILKCGIAVFPPGLGYLKLRHFVPPLGKVYFVFYNPGLWPWQQLRQARELLDYIRVRMGRPAGSIVEQPPPVEREKKDNSLKARAMRCLGFGLLTWGVVFFSRVFVGWPGPGFRPPIEPGQTLMYRWNVYWWYFCHRVLDWPLNLFAAVALLGGVVALRFNRGALSLAAAMGALLAGIMARFFGA